MRRTLNEVSFRDEKKHITVFLDALSNIKDDTGAHQLFDQLLTTSEKAMLGRRLLIARMLIDGYSHREICGQLKASPNTTRTISRWLSAKLPGYNDALEEIMEEAEVRQEERKASRRKNYYTSDPFTFSSMKSRYPAHFLLFNILDAVLSPPSKSPHRKRKIKRKNKNNSKSSSSILYHKPA